MIGMQPPRGAFDYLLDPIRDQLQPPPSPPERSKGGSPQRIPTARLRAPERRAAKRDIVGAIIGLIIFAVLVWGIFGLLAVLAWGFPG